jgi:dTMP kinase
MIDNKLIVIEGLSFAGKTTIVELLYRVMASKFRNRVVQTQEPWKETSTVENRLSGYELLDYVCKDRQEHLRYFIEPKLLAEKWIICSRYYPSTLVYQVLDGCDLDVCLEKNQDFLIPGLTVYLHASQLSIDIRASQRLRGKNRFEKLDFRKKERAQYEKVMTILKAKNWNILPIDTTDISPDQVIDIILKHLGVQSESN